MGSRASEITPVLATMLKGVTVVVDLGLGVGVLVRVSTRRREEPTPFKHCTDFIIVRSPVGNTTHGFQIETYKNSRNIFAVLQKLKEILVLKGFKNR